jgi:nitronate monooxygenase
MAELIAAFRPPVVSFHFGQPAAALVAQVKAWGARVMASATTVDEARWLEAHGADIVIAQGVEAGGHRGMFLSADLTTQIGTLALVPQVVRAVRCPVVAAGGIADAQGVRAVLALGAVAAQVGTAYLLCDEATTTPLHRAALAGAAAEHTALTNLFTGRPARGIFNRLMRELGPLCEDAPAFPLAAAALAPLRARAEALGRTDFTPLWSGQNARGCRAVGAAALTRALAGSE